MLKTAFTNSPWRRYCPAMLLFAAAIALSPPPQRHVAAASVQAEATIRVIQGATLVFRTAADADGRKVRDTFIRTPTDVRPAHLVEFE